MNSEVPPAVTFAIPCCDAGPFLRPLLESLLAQTRQDFRLLLVDDASTDGSVELARDVAGDRVEVHENPERLGLAANWNRCAELVATPMFCLAHMDDVYEPQYLERMVPRLEQRPKAALVHCHATTIDATGEPFDAASERYKRRFWTELDDRDSALVFRRLMRGNFIVCPSVLYRTEAWRALGGVDRELRFAADWKLWFAALLAGYEIVAEPRSLVRYRRHTSNATRDQIRSLRRYEEELAVLDWAGPRGVAAAFVSERQASRRTALRNTLLYDAYCDLRDGDRETLQSKLAFLEEVPALRRDALVRVFRRLARFGRLGRAALAVGLRAALLAARRPG